MQKTKQMHSIKDVFLKVYILPDVYFQNTIVKYLHNCYCS